MSAIFKYVGVSALYAQAFYLESWFKAPHQSGEKIQ